MRLARVWSLLKCSKFLDMSSSEDPDLLSRKELLVLAAELQRQVMASQE
jgi:hypothetical protein